MSSFIDSIPLITNENLQEYGDDRPRTREEAFVGRRKKKAYRADKSLYEDLLKGENNSYVTRMDELLRIGYTPQRLSVIVKDTFFHKGIKDVLASRMMNYFGTETTFDRLLRDVKGNVKVMSVDFAHEDEIMYSMDDLHITLTGFLKDDLTLLEKSLDKLYFLGKRDHFDIISREEFDRQKEKVLKDFAYRMIVQQQLIGDSDFHADNYAIIARDNGSIRLAPAFDKEDSFELSSTEHFGYVTEMNIEYLKVRYSDIFKQLDKKIETLLATDILGKQYFEKLAEEQLPNISQVEDIDKLYDLFRGNLVHTQKVMKNACRGMI